MPLKTRPPEAHPPQQDLPSWLAECWASFHKKWHQDNQGLMGGLPPALAQALQHMLGTCGKGLRPMMIFWLAYANGYDGPTDPLITLALAFENLHTASLLHDDVLDEGKLRRGRACLHRMVGNKPAILLGDLLWANAWRHFLALDNGAITHSINTVLFILLQGQLEEEGLSWNTTTQAYLALIYKKTASLFEALCVCTSKLLGLSPQACQALAAYGNLWGQSFQLGDDSDDYRLSSATHSPHDVGQDRGQDFHQRKQTFPTLWAYHHTTPPQRQRLVGLWHHPAGEEHCSSAPHLQNFCNFLQEIGALDATDALCHSLARQGEGHLRWALADEHRCEALLSFFRKHLPPQKNSRRRNTTVAAPKRFAGSGISFTLAVPTHQFRSFMSELSTEMTLSILKPDATRRNLTGAINQCLEEAGLRIIAQRRLHLTHQEAARFYAVHAHRPFFQELCSIMSSGPIVAQVLHGENAVERYRHIMGDTNPENAAPGTIRQRFSLSISENTVHGSDSLENAAQEICFFFSTLDLLPA